MGLNATDQGQSPSTDLQQLRPRRAPSYLGSGAFPPDVRGESPGRQRLGTCSEQDAQLTSVPPQKNTLHKMQGNARKHNVFKRHRDCYWQALLLPLKNCCRVSPKNLPKHRRGNLKQNLKCTRN